MEQQDDSEVEEGEEEAQPDAPSVNLRETLELLYENLETVAGISPVKILRWITQTGHDLSLELSYRNDFEIVILICQSGQTPTFGACQICLIQILLK